MIVKTYPDAIDFDEVADNHSPFHLYLFRVKYFVLIELSKQGVAAIVEICGIEAGAILPRHNDRNISNEARMRVQNADHVFCAELGKLFADSS